MQANPNAEQQLYQFQYIKERRDMFINQMELIRASLNNLYNTKATVDNLKKVKDGDEILVPIGGMINLKAIVKEPDKVLFYVSKDVVIEKDLDSAIEYIDTLIKQHQEQMTYIGQQIQQLEITLQQLSEQFRGTNQQLG